MRHGRDVRTPAALCPVPDRLTVIRARCVLHLFCAWQAIKIYLAKSSRTARDSTSAALASEYGITMKAVRDIWNLRTWRWETMPFWSSADTSAFLAGHLCASCKARDVRALEQACTTCAGPRRRGRPRKEPCTAGPSSQSSSFQSASSALGGPGVGSLPCAAAASGLDARTHAAVGSGMLTGQCSYTGTVHRPSCGEAIPQSQSGQQGDMTGDRGSRAVCSMGKAARRRTQAPRPSSIRHQERQSIRGHAMGGVAGESIAVPGAQCLALPRQDLALSGTEAYGFNQCNAALSRSATTLALKDVEEPELLDRHAGMSAGALFALSWPLPRVPSCDAAIPEDISSYLQVKHDHHLTHHCLQPSLQAVTRQPSLQAITRATAGAGVQGGNSTPSQEAWNGAPITGASTTASDVNTWDQRRSPTLYLDTASASDTADAALVSAESLLWHPGSAARLPPVSLYLDTAFDTADAALVPRVDVRSCGRSPCDGSPVPGLLASFDTADAAVGSAESLLWHPGSSFPNYEELNAALQL